MPSLAQTNEFAADLSWWDHSFAARGAVGYSDNLLLSPNNREKSLSFNGGVDFTLFRLPLDGKEFTLFLSSDYTHYPSGGEVEHEAFALALARFKSDFSQRWRAGVDLQYFFQDQVIDASITETNSGPLPIRGHSFNLRPSLRYDFGKAEWLEMGLSGTRQFYQQPLDDYWEEGPQVTIGHNYGFGSSLSLAYRWTWRHYQHRTEVTEDGFGLPGTSLQFQQNELEAALRHHFDAAKHWRSAFKAGVLTNEDSGSGYFDFIRLQLSAQLRYVATLWEIKGSAKVAGYDFTTQKRSPTDSSNRRKYVAGGQLRGERKLSPSVKVFVEYAFEEAVSNLRSDEYLNNKTAVGVEWEF